MNIPNAPNREADAVAFKGFITIAPDGHPQWFTFSGDDAASMVLLAEASKTNNQNELERLNELFKLGYETHGAVLIIANNPITYPVTPDSPSSENDSNYGTSHGPHTQPPRPRP